MNIVIDTNVFISAYLWGGLPLSVLRTIANHQDDIVIMSSNDLLTEFTRVIQYPKFTDQLNLKSQTPQNLVAQYKAITKQVIADPTIVNIFRDPKDDMVLACALGGGASIIVSSDKDVLSKKSYREIRFLSVEAFLKEISV